jgi:hypothetical protein
MSRKIVGVWAGLLLLVGIPFAFAGVEGVPSCKADPASAVLASIEQSLVPMGIDPALCGTCLNCSSSNLCYGLLIGDPCNHQGGTCQAVNGCALANCCRCANAPPSLF